MDWTLIIYPDYRQATTRPSPILANRSHQYSLRDSPSNKVRKSPARFRGQHLLKRARQGGTIKAWFLPHGKFAENMTTGNGQKAVS